jgi:hypothetical protein
VCRGLSTSQESQEHGLWEAGNAVSVTGFVVQESRVSPAMEDYGRSPLSPPPPPSLPGCEEMSP